MNQQPMEYMEMNGAGSSPLLAFREIVELSTSELFGYTEGNKKKISREVYSLLSYCADLRRQSILTAESVRGIVEAISTDVVMHMHLQELTADVLFQFSSLGDRHHPYSYEEVVDNFVFTLTSDVKNNNSLLNRDNQLSLNFYQDRQSIKALMAVNPWLMVVVVLCFDSKRYSDYEVAVIAQQS